MSSEDGVALIPGWNLISLPKEPDSVDPATVFSSITGSFTEVHTYDACDAADPWRAYNPAAAPGDNDLTSVDHRSGLWVRATAAATLAISGSEPAETSVRLCQGWNLIGYPLAQPRPVLAALSSIAGKFLRVYGWDPNDPVDPWEVFDVAVPAWANDLLLMQPGRGYWIFATDDTTLVMSNAGLPPEVEITAPAHAATVTAPTDVVGTVTSDLLEGWTLAYRLKGETGAFTTFASGNVPVTNGVLGKLDPTLLLNGLYEIELTATDFQGQSVSASIDVIVEGNLKIGHFTLSFTDLEVPVAGLPIQVVRTYDSRDKRLGDFGVGWTLSVSNVRLQEDGPVGESWQGTRSSGITPTYCVIPMRNRRVTVTLPDNTTLRFEPRVSPQCQSLAPPQVVTLSYAPLPGTFATLEMLDQNPQALVVGSFPGSIQLWDQDSVELQDPGRYRLTFKDGRQLVIDQVGGLRTIRDLNGNELTLDRNGITHSSGMGIAFERDAQDRITRITDPEGESLTFSYDTASDLIAVTDRDEATTRFTYDDHYLLSIQDPLGRQPIRNEYDDSGRLVRTTDAFGKTIELSHDLAANREVVTDRLGHSQVLEYDARGNVIRETNALGKTTTRTFDENDRLTSETNPLGHTVRYAYDANGNRTEVRDPLGNRTSFTYNARGQVLTTTDARGNTTRNAYDAAGNLLETEDPLGNSTVHTYDSRGNLLTATDAEGAVTTYSYDARGNLLQQTDALGRVTSYTYDRNGNRLSQTTTRTTATGTETLTWSYQYDASGRLTSTTDPDGTVAQSVYDALGNPVELIDKLGRRTILVYDELGRRTSMRFPDGTVEAWTYDAEGQRLTTTDRGGRTTRYAYDAVGRLLRTIHADGAVVTNAYDDAGRLMATTDARNNTTAYEYDAAGRRTLVRNALGQEMAFDYDAVGNKVAATDARNNTTVYEYDPVNRLVRVLFPDGTSIRTDHDRVGRRTSETDQAGLTTRFGYDLAGRLASVTDALGQVTRYSYDEQGNRVSQTDANAHVTRFEYDAVGRQTRRILPDGLAETFTYQSNNNRQTRRDFNGALTTYAYDLNDRLLSRSYPDGTSVSFTYTPSGRRASATDSRGTTTYAYDSRDRLIRLTYPDGRELRYGYDLNGNRTSMTAQIGTTALTTTYTFDALNRLATVTSPDGKVYTHAYDENGNRASLSYPNGITTTYQYDALNRLTDLATVTGTGSAVQRYAYTLGPRGNRTRVEEHDGTVRSYTYDPLYRLTGEAVSDSTGEVYRKVFSYGPVGNRLRQQHSDAGAPATTRTYTYDTRDRLLNEDATAYTWDAEGRLTANGEASYAWEPEDRLKQVTMQDGTVVRHTYDADGVRVRTEVSGPGGAVNVTEYLVDTSGPLSQVVAEGPTTATVSALYVRGDDLLAVLRGAATRFYHADGLGSIRALTDEAGAVTDRYDFTAFGELLRHEGNDPNAYLFAGEPLDPNSGFYYNRARWMDPRVGRFTSMDPFEGLPGDPATLHKYLYAAANPVDLVDPTGRFSGPGLVVAVVIVVIVIALTYWAFRPQKQDTPTPLEKLSPFRKAMDAAAIQGMQSIREICLAENWEYCGAVCVNPDGITCQPGPVVRGKERGDCSNYIRCTAPLETVAVFHCHPDNGWAGDEGFSIEDQSNVWGVSDLRAIYLITPSGRMKRYTKWEGSVDLNP